jgi:hypothetical protein
MQLLEERIFELNHALNDLKSGAENDSKNSAGDKHETARAMMQLEQEKITRQLDEVIKQQNELKKMDINVSSPVIVSGTLVRTNIIYMFLAIPLGKVVIDGIPVMVLSPQSPIGMKLTGRKTGGSFELNGLDYRIEEFS